jgi:hypothetical protein
MTRPGAVRPGIDNHPQDSFIRFVLWSLLTSGLLKNLFKRADHLTGIANMKLNNRLTGRML